MNMNRQFVHIVESKEVPISSNECRCECRPPRAVKQYLVGVSIALVFSFLFSSPSEVLVYLNNGNRDDVRADDGSKRSCWKLEGLQLFECMVFVVFHVEAILSCRQVLSHSGFPTCSCLLVYMYVVVLVGYIPFLMHGTLTEYHKSFNVQVWRS